MEEVFMKRLCAVIFILLLVSLADAQQRWERTYGRDEGKSVQQTTDGGYIVAGYTMSFANGTQFYLIKTNSFGDILWTRTYGETGNDYGYSVQWTSDGGYIVAGKYNAGGSTNRVYLIKTNASGDTLWTKTYEGGAYENAGYSVQQTSDGGYIVAGYTDSIANSDQVFLIKTNATGDILWTRTYGGTDQDFGYSVQQTSDTGYIVAGTTASFGNLWKVYLIKTNASGDTLWTRVYGGTGQDEGRSVQQTSDGGYIIAGFSSSFGAGMYDVYLIKTSATGDTLWTRTYGGMDEDYGYSVQQTQEGGYIVAGTTTSFGNLWKVYLIKTNTRGDTLWTRTYGGVNYSEGYSVQQTTDGGYIVTGYTVFGPTAQVYLIKTDSLGNSTGVEENAEIRGQKLEVRLTATPNPFVSFASVPGHEAESFTLYDVSGRRVGTYKGDRIGEGLRAGVYFVRAEDGSTKPVRVVKVR
jgi:hypothetical protein